jgi:hypothetical protein
VGEVAAAVLEGERAFLDELNEVFVVKGDGHWVESDDEGSDLSELGTLPLGELRRRHERGEL